MRRAQLVIGQSHVAAFRAAARLRREQDPEAPRTRTIHIHEPRWGAERTQGFAPDLAAEICDQIARHDPLVASVIGGNGHNALALLRHPRPYDLHLGEGPPVDAAAEPVPVALVEAAVAQALGPDLARMRTLHALVGPFVQIESPPPVRDDGFILAHADAFFADRGIAARGVAGAGLRFRVWRLACRLVAREAAALGCTYLPVPAAARDAEGFLPATLATDATHGNADYGAIMIDTLDAL